MIEKLEAESAELAEKLSDSEFVVANVDKLEEINARIEWIKSEDARLMSRWEELEKLRASLEG